MKSFTKNVLVASLLLASTSALAANLVTSPGPSGSGPAGNGEQSNETLSWMSFAESELYFKNESSGAENYIAAVTVAYLSKDPAAPGKYIPTTKFFMLGTGEDKLLTLKGDDALVKVTAQKINSKSNGDSLPILNLNLCSYNNKYYNPTTGGGKGKSRKDIIFFGGNTTPEMISYPSTKLKKDGYYELNIGDFECWIDQPQS